VTDGDLVVIADAVQCCRSRIRQRSSETEVHKQIGFPLYLLRFPAYDGHHHFAGNIYS